MTTISISVDDDVAAAYKAASEQDRTKLQLLLKLRLQELVSRPGRPLDQIMDEIGLQAEARGLTAEELESSLHDD